ncbi:MAG: phBC6A51 family helix-turn-helix protein [Candidatus Competibacter sp.]|nr:phBC6A51 family helix-turn-helix protein [Candidatus Competibacter sp.]MDG4585321.1 phBC6A51 family helix-turn-helix protein [Candidatus Competibacter sp.]
MEKQLPPKQLLAAQLLADGLPFKQVSEKVGVSLSVVYKWKHIPAFNSYVNELLMLNENKAYQDLFSLKPLALETLKAMLNSKDSRTAIKAAELILTYGT